MAETSIPSFPVAGLTCAATVFNDTRPTSSRIRITERDFFKNSSRRRTGAQRRVSVMSIAEPPASNVICQMSHVECHMYLSNYLLTKRPNAQLNQLGNLVVGSFG